MKKFFSITYIVITLLICSKAWARFATPSEADAEQELANIKINVNQDGDYEVIKEMQYKILNEVGREELATQSFTYNSGNEKVEIIEAKTIIEGKDYKVSQDMIEDKTLAGGASGFDDMNRIQLAYPNIVVGASVYYKVKTQVKNAIYKGFFEATFSPGLSELYIKHYNIELSSKLKLNMEVNDPNNKLDVKSSNGKDGFNLKIKLKSPLIEKLVNESGSLIKEQMTYVAVTTLDDYGQFVQNVAPHYEQVINAELPPLLGEIVSSASKITNEIDQINYVTSNLAHKIRYMGDWRTVKGKFFPRNFQEVVQSGYGDCKDFTSMTVAILRKLGYKAHPSLVRRGEGIYFSKPKIPNALLFNHVLVQVQSREGKTLWIDPTNFVSYAGGIFPDIADRPALVLDLEKPTYTEIPAISAGSATNENNNEITLASQGDATIKGILTIKGEAATSWTGIGLVFSKKELEEKIAYMLSGEVSPEKVHMKLPDLTSRIVQDITVDYSYDLDNISYQTNLGLAYEMGNRWPETYINIPQDQVGMSYVGFPRTHVQLTRFKNIKSITPQALDSSIKSKWFDTQRSCAQDGQDIVCNEKTVFHSSFITLEDIKSSEFMKIKKLLKRYFVDSALIYN